MLTFSDRPLTDSDISDSVWVSSVLRWSLSTLGISPALCSSPARKLRMPARRDRRSRSCISGSGSPSLCFAGRRCRSPTQGTLPTRDRSAAPPAGLFPSLRNMTSSPCAPQHPGEPDLLKRGRQAVARALASGGPWSAPTTTTSRTATGKAPQVSATLSLPIDPSRFPGRPDLPRSLSETTDCARRGFRRLPACPFL